MVLAAALRLPGVEFDLPLFTHPDEGFIVDHSMAMLANGDSNPRWFEYPSLVLYLNSALYASGAKLIGAASAADVDPVQLRRWARTMTVVFAVATVPVVYAAAALAFGQAAGLAAAFLMAASRLHVANSFAVTTDAPAAFGVALALWAALAIALEGATPRRHLLAGAAVGLAAGTKYPAVFVALSVIVAHFASAGFDPRQIWRRGALAGASAAGAVFLATTPWSVLDFETFRATLSWQSEHFATGHAGAQTASATSYGQYLAWSPDTLGIAGGLLTLAGLATTLRTRPRAAFVLLAFPAAYLAMMGSHKVAFERYLVLLLPAFVVMASASVGLVARLPKRAAAIGAVALCVAWFAAIASEAVASREYVVMRTLPDTRLLADTWIRANLPKGARVGREFSTPKLDGSGLRVTDLGTFGLIRGLPLGDFDFLVASSADYGRFVNHPEMYPRQAKEYARKFEFYPEIARFTATPGQVSGPTILVLATDEGRKLLEDAPRTRDGSAPAAR